MKKRKVVRVNLMQTQIDTLFKLRDELAAANGSGSLGAIIGQPVIDNTGLAVTGYVKFTVDPSRSGGNRQDHERWCA